MKSERTIFTILVLLFLAVAPASAQKFNEASALVTNTTTCNQSQSSPGGGCVFIDTKELGVATVTIVDGTTAWSSGTLTFQISNDFSNWYAIEGTAKPAGTLSSTATAPGAFGNFDIGGWKWFRAVASGSWVGNPRVIVAGTSVPSVGAAATLEGDIMVDLGTVDDGIGTPTDAAATQGGEGSLSAKLRTVTSQLNTISVTGIPITGTVSSAQSGTWNITNISGTISLPTGAATAANQTTEIAAVDGLEGGLGAAADAAATQGSTGSVSAKLRTVTSQLNTIATTGIPITGTVTVGSHAVTNAGTFAVQLTGATNNINNVSGTISLPTGASTAANQTTAIGHLSDIVTSTGDSTTELQAINASFPAVAAGADNVSNPSLSAIFAYLMCFDSSTWDRCPTSTGGAGNVDANTTRVSLALDDDLSDAGTLIKTQMVADGVGTAGNPFYVGGLSTTSIVTQTPVANAQRIGFVGGIDRVQITRPHANLEDRLVGDVAIADGASTALGGGFAAGGSGVRVCATTLIVGNSSTTATSVDIRDGAAGAVLLNNVPAAAGQGGAVIPLQVPICTTANTALAADPADDNDGTLTVNAVGFKTEL